jgi:hypothetical protein
MEGDRTSWKEIEGGGVRNERIEHSGTGQVESLEPYGT